MAGGGIGEAALIGAALGGASSAVTGQDPLKGALLGGLTGGVGSGLMGAAGAAGAAGTAGLDAGASAFTGATPTGLATLAGEGAAASSPGILGALGSMSTPAKLALGATGVGLLGAMGERGGDMPGMEKYNGPLSKFQYNPNTYTPYTYKPYAGGGPVETMSNANAVGANTGFPMANISRGAYATPYQQPISQNVVTGPQDTRVDPYTGEPKLAGGGGISDLGSYSDGGRLLRGPGDGVSDSIPAMIGQKQPARLADGEFVVPARIVSELGNGSTDAGARELYKMMDRVQSGRAKTVGKGRVAKDTRATKHLPA
jgi:hypothetical protein